MGHNPYAKSPITLSTFGGLVSFCSPDNVPAGASPRCHDVDFSIGGVATRKGTRSVYSFADYATPSTLGGDVEDQPTAGNAWINPSNAISTSLYASALVGAGTDELDITQFAFSIPETSSLQGIKVTMGVITTSTVTFIVQLILNGEALGAGISVDFSGSGLMTFGGPGDSWGQMLTSANANNTTFGFRVRAVSAFSAATVYVQNSRITLYQSAPSANFQYLKTFTATNGDVKNLCMDSNGEMFLENVSMAPGVLTALIGGLPTSSYAKSITLNDREYIAFNNLVTGDDLPLQYTGDWIDRITQEGPGAPPVVTAIPNTGNSYAIDQITQPAAQTRGSSYYLKSSGPGSNTTGNVATIYYSDSTVAGPDTDLVNAFNSGNPVYLYFSFTGAPTTIGPTTVLVTSVGLASPPSQPRKFYYFTYQDVTTEYVYYQGSGHPGYTANYQRTLATMQTAVPVPGIAVNSNVTITGNSVAAYNASWRISQLLNSATVTITQSQLTAGVATFSYTVVTGTPPAGGQLISITNTLNANGILNGDNLTIASASGGASGTFTIGGYSAVTDYPVQGETAQGVTAGTLFDFDPGTLTLGSATNPIHGTGTGGSIIFSPSGTTIGTGTRQAVLFFGTRNSALTFPSIPVVFTVPDNTGALQFSLLAIGPPNVILRGIAITEAGQNGIPGANFYALPDPVQYTLNGTSYTSDSTYVRDNTTTSVTLAFRDQDLLSGQAIDVQGNDLFNQVEIGNPAWITSYASRVFYGLTQSKVQNFINLSFDGGYLSNAGIKKPLGWTYDPESNGTSFYGELINSSKFGNSYYIHNSSGAVRGTVGLISQSAYRSYYQVPILNQNVLYSVRVAARIPSGVVGGNLVVDIVSSTTFYGAFILPFSQMNTTMAEYEGTILINAMGTVPSDLIIRVYGQNMPGGSDLDIDRVQIFPTRQPVNTTKLLVSYASNPEGVDGVTGQLDTNSENTQPCMGAVVMYDLLYLLKTGSMYYTQDSASDEPDQWTVHEVSNKAGAIGVNAYDSGEEWIVMANRSGVYLFTGGEPRKISTEIQEIWDAINWSAGASIWVRNDIQERQLLVGIPLPTPNFWLPDAAVNSAPSYPNVILMLRYTGQDSGEEISSAQPIYATQFGNLDTADMRRKWTLWQIPSPYADYLRTDATSPSAPLRIGNGVENSKVYAIDAATDDGALIPYRYVTYGFGGDGDKAKIQGLGAGRVRMSYFISTITGTGTTQVNTYANKLDSAVNSSFTIALADGSEDREMVMNAVGYRSYVEFTPSGTGSVMDLSRMQLMARKDVFNQIRGVQ